MSKVNPVKLDEVVRVLENSALRKSDKVAVMPYFTTPMGDRLQLLSTKEGMYRKKF